MDNDERNHPPHVLRALGRLPAENVKPEPVDPVTVERNRCLAILRAAREGEIDGDLRSLIFRIESGECLA